MKSFKHSKIFKFFSSDKSLILINFPIVFCAISIFIGFFVPVTQARPWIITRTSIVMFVLVLGIFFAEYKSVWPGLSSVVLLSIPTFMFIFQTNNGDENETMFTISIILVLSMLPLLVIAILLYFFVKKWKPKIYFIFMQFNLIISNVALCLYCAELISVMNNAVVDGNFNDIRTLKPDNYTIFFTAITTMLLAIGLGSFSISKKKAKNKE